MLSGYKTYITAGLAIIGAVAAYAMGDASIFQMAQIVVPAIIGVFLRSGSKTDAVKLATDVLNQTLATQHAGTYEAVKAALDNSTVVSGGELRDIINQGPNPTS